MRTLKEKKKEHGEKNGIRVDADFDYILIRNK